MKTDLSSTMSAAYSDENLNFFRLTKCVVDHSTAALRKVFIQEWNNLYPCTPWQNNTTSGSQLLVEEMPPSRRSRLYDPTYCNEYRHIKNHLSCGDVERWDVTSLVFALNHSYALSSLRCRFNSRGKKILNAIHQIKEVRNTVSAHACKASISYGTFNRSVNILIQAVEDLLTKSDPVVGKLQQMLMEDEFTTKDLVTYKQLLKNDHDNLLRLERAIERLEDKIEKPVYKSKIQQKGKTRRSHLSDHRERFSSLHHRITKLEPYVNRRSVTTAIDQVPSNFKPEIFRSGRYIKLINKSNFLSFNFRWEDLEKLLQGFTSNVVMKVFAGIQAASALNQRSRKEESVQMLNGLIPYALVTENGYVRQGLIRHGTVRKAAAGLQSCRLPLRFPGYSIASAGISGLGKFLILIS